MENKKTTQQKIREEQATLDYLHMKGRVDIYEYEHQMEELLRLEGQPDHVAEKTLRTKFLVY